MNVIQAPFPAFGVDCVTTLDAVRVRALVGLGIRYCCRYLGSVTAAELATILSGGLGFMPVTYADRFNGAQSVAELEALRIPQGATVWLDVEGVGTLEPANLIAQINAWATNIAVARFQPGLYVGANALLTSAELYALQVVRYWKGMSRLVDRNGNIAEPSCGWCLSQFYKTVTLAGTQVDVDAIGYDYQDRLPMVVTG